MAISQQKVDDCLKRFNSLIQKDKIKLLEKLLNNADQDEITAHKFAIDSVSRSENIFSLYTVKFMP